MSEAPNGDMLVAPEFGVREVVFLARKKSVDFPEMFSSLETVFNKGRRYPPLLPALKIVLSVNCILSHVVVL